MCIRDRYPGPTSRRSADSPLPIGLTSPGLPLASRSIRRMMRALPRKSLSFSSHISNSSVRTTSIICRLYLTVAGRASRRHRPSMSRSIWRSRSAVKVAQSPGVYRTRSRGGSVRLNQGAREALTYTERLVVVVVAAPTFARLAEVAEPSDLGVVRGGVVLDVAHTGPMQRLKDDQSPAAEFMGERAEGLCQRCTRDPRVSAGQVVTRHENLGCDSVAPTFDLGLAIGAGVLVADATGCL